MESLQNFKGLQQGEQWAFDRFFKQWYASLVFFAFKIINNKAQAEEIAGDSMLKLWQQREQLIHPAGLSAFLYSITKNACLNYLRDQQRHNGKAAAYIHTLDNHSPSIDQAIIETETLRELYNRMAALPAQCKTIMEQLYVEGKTASEVAAAGKLSIHTVRVQKMIGIRKLKAAAKGLP